MASFAAEIASDSSYNAVFWTTSYFTFCAISILVVYLTLYRNVENRRELEALLERAMQGHKRLDQSTELEAQRLLEESQTLARTAGQPTSHDFVAADTSTLSGLAAPVVANEAGVAVSGVDTSQGYSAAPNHGLGSLCNANDAFHDLVSCREQRAWFQIRGVADRVAGLVRLGHVRQ